MTNERKIKRELIARAIKRHGKISKVTTGRYMWSACFTVEDGKIWFWYNDQNEGTHCVHE